MNEHYDKGGIVLQQSVDILKDDTPETLAKKVLKIEHSIYLQVVQLFCSDKIKNQY